MIRKLKDNALSKGAKAACNTLMSKYGKVLKLNVDSHAKSLTAEVMLEGEKEPLFIEVERYELFREEGRDLLKLYGIRTSRAWVNTLATNYVEGRSFEIPPEYAKIVKILL